MSTKVVNCHSGLYINDESIIRSGILSRYYIQHLYNARLLYPLMPIIHYPTTPIPILNSEKSLQMIRPHYIILILTLPSRLLIRHLPVNLRPRLTPRLPLPLPLTTSHRMSTSTAHQSMACFAFVHVQWKMAIAVDGRSIDSVEDWLLAA